MTWVQILPQPVYGHFPLNCHLLDPMVHSSTEIQSLDLPSGPAKTMKCDITAIEE